MAEPTESVTVTVRQIRRATRKKYSAEETSAFTQKQHPIFADWLDMGEKN